MKKPLIVCLLMLLSCNLLSPEDEFTVGDAKRLIRDKWVSVSTPVKKIQFGTALFIYEYTQYYYIKGTYIIDTIEQISFHITEISESSGYGWDVGEDGFWDYELLDDNTLKICFHQYHDNPVFYEFSRVK